MKLYFKTILVVAALATAVFVSCNKNNDPYGDDDNYVAQPVVTPTLSPPRMAPKSRVSNLPNPDMLSLPREV